MVHSCCMVGCANRQNKEAGISLHRIPHFPEERKEAWVKIINRVVVDGGKQRLWRPNDNARVCSIHFLGGKCIFLRSDVVCTSSKYVEIIFSLSL